MHFVSRSRVKNHVKECQMVSGVSASTWLQAHIYLGWLSCFVFLLHTGGRIPAGRLEGMLAAAFIAVATGAGLADHPGQGIGLANIRERLTLLHGNRAHLALEANDPHGFIARIVLPAAPGELVFPVERATAAPAER